jgi:hypothetical protein
MSFMEPPGVGGWTPILSVWLRSTREAEGAWESETASPVTSSPAVAKAKVVVATADGQVICFG